MKLSKQNYFRILDNISTNHFEIEKRYNYMKPIIIITKDDTYYLANLHMSCLLNFQKKLKISSKWQVSDLCVNKEYDGVEKVRDSLQGICTLQLGNSFTAFFLQYFAVIYIRNL